jgi:AcrR family transcriptional regulator
MYEKFLNLSDDKKNKIINAALKVFSKTTYKKASTDEIVEAAGISKGALFHYFNSKKNLYLYLYDYIIDVLLKEYYARINMQERDIFERLKNIVAIKMSLLSKYPDVFNFAINAMQEENTDLQNKLQSKNKDMTSKNYKLLLDNIDRSKFREDIDADTAIDMIMMTFEGYGNRELLRVRTLGYSQTLSGRWLDEFDKYIEIMKKIYYRGV